MLFPKTKEKKKRMRHPASILHDKNSRTCYLCVTLHDNWNEHRILDEHHVFGGPNRKKSSIYLSDNVHPNDEGGKKVANVWVNALKSNAELIN